MHRSLLILVLTLSLFGVLLAGGASVSLPAGAAFRPFSDNVAIRPNSKTVTGGDSFTLDIQIEGSDLVTGADVQITFDTVYLEVISLTHSGVFDGYFVNNSSLAAGLIWVGGGTFGTRTPPFSFFTLTVRAKIPGTTTLVFNPAETDVQGVNGSVRGSLINGSVVIEPGVTLTPTMTPINTPTATSTPTLQPNPTPSATASVSPTPTASVTPGGPATATSTATASRTPTLAARKPLYLPLVVRWLTP